METNQTNITPPQPTPNVQQPVSNPVQNPTPIQPQTFPASEQPSGSKWRLILIILLILSIFSFGGYYLVLPKMGINILPTPTPTPTIAKLPTPTPITTNWKTYTNTKNRYSFKYPQTSELSENSYGYIWIDKQIEIYVTKINPKDCRGDCPVIEDTQIVNIASLNAERLTGYIGAIGGNVPHSYERIVLTNNNQYYILTLHEIPFDSKDSPERKIGRITEEDKRVFNQILSTFKFTQ